jgi:alkaline phosphatase
MKRTLRNIGILFCILSVSCSAFAAQGGDEISLPDTGPRYIFLFIGDGMGPVHVKAAELFAQERSLGDTALLFSDFPVMGWASTGNIFGAVTDSSAAGTAIASGWKTANGLLNTNPQNTKRYPTIAQFGKSLGRKIGVVSSVSIDHATPAAFYATSSSRSDYYEIALQSVSSNFDYFAGEKFLQPRGEKGDKTDIYKKATDAGYNIVTLREDVKAIGAESGPLIAIADTSNALSLAELTAAGIRALDNPKGFFMMIEGGKIDWESHDNHSENMLKEVIALDAAVAVAHDFLLKRPQETLIVVTADHETGGLVLNMDLDPGTVVIQRMRWTKTGHTGVDVQVFALGIGQELFCGTYDNTGIFRRIHALMEASEPQP